ncbi:uncharacterized protein LOC107651734 [Monodelphis domestica]|uniref:uncharacterized protein LOC107651734 n=1 Tax=Monodelphis domestica TaxID=13616 RepID=UPI0024E2315D|nr:uncharacterized protein LOC107651734 [Monodelphis domestica]
MTSFKDVESNSPFRDGKKGVGHHESIGATQGAESRWWLSKQQKFRPCGRPFLNRYRLNAPRAPKFKLNNRTEAGNPPSGFKSKGTPPKSWNPGILRAKGKAERRSQDPSPTTQRAEPPAAAAGTSERAKVLVWRVYFVSSGAPGSEHPAWTAGRKPGRDGSRDWVPPSGSSLTVASGHIQTNPVEHNSIRTPQSLGRRAKALVDSREAAGENWREPGQPSFPGVFRASQLHTTYSPAQLNLIQSKAPRGQRS